MRNCTKLFSKKVGILGIRKRCPEKKCDCASLVCTHVYIKWCCWYECIAMVICLIVATSVSESSLLMGFLLVIRLPLMALYDSILIDWLNCWLWKCCAEKIVLPLQSRHKLVYYHRHYRRVPTIDECEVDDQVCAWEANQQYRRDRSVSHSLT